jgi:hypothetical protein
LLRLEDGSDRSWNDGRVVSSGTVRLSTDRLDASGDGVAGGSFAHCGPRRRGAALLLSRLTPAASTPDGEEQVVATA